MPTRSVMLSDVEYVRINVGKHPITLQAPRDEVRVVISDVKPSRDNTVFHTIGDDEICHFEHVDTNMWALAINPTKSSLIVTEMTDIFSPKQLSQTQFNETVIASMRPVTQFTSHFNLPTVTESHVSNGGSVTVNNRLFNISSGNNAAGQAQLTSSRYLKSGAGQGATARFSAWFSVGVINNRQQAGLMNACNSLTFGYDHSSFGLFHQSNGVASVMRLVVTNSTNNNQNVVLTVDGEFHVIPVTAGSESHNAFEIATFLQLNELRYDVSSNQNNVTLVQVYANSTSTFDFDAGGAIVANWLQISAGVDIHTNFIPQSEWNEDVADWLDVYSGNQYEISYNSTFGTVEFYIMHTTNGDYTLVHRIYGMNQTASPLLNDPNMRVGWRSVSTGNTSAVTISAGDAGLFIQGDQYRASAPYYAQFEQRPKGDLNSNVNTNILTVRNRYEFAGYPNTNELHLVLVSVSTLGVKPMAVTLTKNPTFVSEVEYFYNDELNSIAEYSITPATLIAGQVIYTYTLIDESPVVERLSDAFDFYLLPGESLSLSVTPVSDSNAQGDVQGSLSWQEGI